MLILGVDLLCQMLAQRLSAVGSEIVVEIPELRLKQPYGYPGLGCSGGQPFRRARRGALCIARQISRPPCVFRVMVGIDFTGSRAVISREAGH